MKLCVVIFRSITMDLYRYFHPHHNPRLREKSIRMQELSELEQASQELKKAIKRAEIRTDESNNEVGGIKKDHFTQILVALDYVVDSLGVLTKAHPGDDVDAMKSLLEERNEAPGWENWSRLLKQRLEIIEKY